MRNDYGLDFRSTVAVEDAVVGALARSKYVEKEYKKPAFVLPNRSYNLFSTCVDRRRGSKKKGVRYKQCKRLYKKHRKKKNMIELDLWNTGSCQVLACADFDNLPDGWESWPQFRKYLISRYPDGKVISSASGKAKVFFVMRMPKGKKFCKQHWVLNTLQDILDVDDYEIIDKEIGAHRHSFISPTQIKPLQAWMPNAEVIDMYYDAKHDRPDFAIADIKNESVVKVLDTLKYRVWDKSRDNHSYKKFKHEWTPLILFLMGNKGLLYNFDLPCGFIAKILKSMDCEAYRTRRITEKKVRAMIDKLVEINFLEITDGSYRKDAKAKTYRAYGVLDTQMVKYHNVVLNKGEDDYGNYKVELPNTFPDGTWERNAWEYAKYFARRPKVYLEQAMRLEGINKKNRLLKFFRAIIRYRRYIGIGRPVKVPCSGLRALKQFEKGLLF